MEFSNFAQNSKTTISLVSTAIFLAGCASSSKDIASSSVSPILYQSYTCDQLLMENARLQSKAVELGGRLDKAADNDKAITGVALILFWPAAFALGGNKGQEAEYARVKGESDAVQQSLVMRNCGATLSPATLTAVANGPLTTQDTSATQVAQANPQVASPAANPKTMPTTLVGTTFVFVDTDTVSRAPRGMPRVVLTREDSAGFEYNNGEYVTDREGNTKSGVYSVVGSNLYRRGALPGQVWQAQLRSSDGASHGDVTVTAVAVENSGISPNGSRQILKTSLTGWMNGPSQRMSTGVSNEKITGQVSFDVASGLPVEYQFDTRNSSFSTTRKLERVQ